VIGVFGNELLDRGHECRERGFHISSAAAIEHAVANGRLERGADPALKGAGGNDIGMTGKTQHGGLFTTACPEVADATDIDTFEAKAERGETGLDQIQAAGILGRFGRT